jgi:hypothetical protein
MQLTGCASPTPPLLESGVGPLFAPTKPPRLLMSSHCFTATSTIRTLPPLQPTMPKLRVVVSHGDGILESLTITCESPHRTRKFARAPLQIPCLTSQLGAFPIRRSLMMINTKMAPRGRSDPLDLNGFSRATYSSARNDAGWSLLKRSAHGKTERCKSRVSKIKAGSRNTFGLSHPLVV